MQSLVFLINELIKALYGKLRKTDKLPREFCNGTLIYQHIFLLQAGLVRGTQLLMKVVEDEQTLESLLLTMSSGIVHPSLGPTVFVNQLLIRDVFGRCYNVQHTVLQEEKEHLR